MRTLRRLVVVLHAFRYIVHLVHDKKNIRFIAIYSFTQNTRRRHLVSYYNSDYVRHHSQGRFAAGVSGYRVRRTGGHV